MSDEEQLTRVAAVNAESRTVESDEVAGVLQASQRQKIGVESRMYKYAGEKDHMIEIGH